VAADWSIDYWPEIGCHTFLSYSREDRNDLVFPVHDGLKQRQVIPWVDRHQYPVGRDGFEALREELLRCRHVVYFITSKLLRQGRGWSAVERTYAELIQRRTTYHGTEFQRFELPLVFVNPSDPILHRSIWFQTLARARFFHLTRRPRQTRVKWAIEQICDFARQEEQWAEDVRIRLRHDADAKQHFSISNGLLRRIRAAAPLPSVS
jgi:TIR domain